MDAPGTAREPVVRRYGPASTQTLRVAAGVRRTLLPLASGWRMTPRGIRMLQRLTDPTEHVPVLRGTEVQHAQVGGIPGEWVRGPRAQAGPDPRTDPNASLVLYLHGGGYVYGSPRTHRNLVSRLSHVTGLAAFSVDYRLPPEWTMPAPVEDALAVYRALLERHDPARIVVAGDSAGGGLAHELALHAAEAGLPAPAGLVLLSPWSDLSASGESVRTNAAADPFIPEIGLRRCARVAVGGGDPADWRVSPLFAPDELQARLPPTLVQVGEGQTLRDDGERVARTLARVGVRSELELYEGTIHVAAVWTGTPEARDALHHIARFVDDVLPADAPDPSARAESEAAGEGGTGLTAAEDDA
ncbi:alpha/beta hydrolase [Patulibacter sp. SYSU D01012]|uniref:alpha/beta hydrolase n=1 Tax=Patulibacter sp. SYSU D01012 TaxID=2817381 RepID=UPI001B310B50|nr:alpha/beta hydrolase [Patulibacter sp. SYSU D01012]